MPKAEFMSNKTTAVSWLTSVARTMWLGPEFRLNETAGMLVLQFAVVDKTR